MFQCIISIFATARLGLYWRHRKMTVSSHNITISAPQGLDARMNEEIAVIWAQVQSRVRQLASGDSENINPSLGIDGVLSQLDQAQPPREASTSKHAKIRASFNNALQVIRSVGEIVALGTSEVCGPMSSRVMTPLR